MDDYPLELDPDFYWKDKNKYKWKIIHGSKLSKVIVGFKDEKCKIEESIVVKLIEIKEEENETSSFNVGKLLCGLREFYFLDALRRLPFFNKLLGIIGPEKENFNKLFFLFKNSGIDLSKTIASENFEYRKNTKYIKWVLFQIIYSINLLHSSEIMHLNISSKNFLVDNQGKVTMCDFGSARKKGYPHERSGTKQYMSPEYLLSLTNYDEKVDMWAIGVIMFELYTKNLDIFIDKNNQDINLGKNIHPNFPTLQLKYVFKKLGINLGEKENEIFGDSNETLNFIYNQKWNKSNFEEVINKIIQEKNDLLSLKLIEDHDAMDLLQGLLAINPKERISSEEALKSNYLKEFIRCIDFSKKPKISVDTSFESEFAKIKDNNEKLKFVKNEIKKKFNILIKQNSG